MYPRWLLYGGWGEGHGFAGGRGGESWGPLRLFFSKFGNLLIEMFFLVSVFFVFVVAENVYFGMCLSFLALGSWERVMQCARALKRLSPLRAGKDTATVRS